MKKNLIVLLLCLSILFVCSCQNGTGSDDIAGGALYKVNLSVELPADGPQRTISVSGGSVAAGDLTYWYKATPNWTNGDAFGKVAEFTQIADYAAETELGPFQQGQWKFDVQVKKAIIQDETIIGYNVIYEGSVTEYINAPDKAVIVVVDRDGTNVAKGTIDFGEIKAARVNPTLNLNKVVMEYGIVGESAIGDPTTVTCASDIQDLSFNIADITNLAAGNYWVKLTYKNGDAVIGSSYYAFTLEGGETAAVTGNLVEGEFQTALITINGISSLSLTEITNSVSAGVVTFTCTATPSADTTYQWYINGEKVVGATESSYAWSPDAKQNASITCTATHGNIVASKSITYQVTVLP